MVPKDVYILILGNSEYVTLYAKRDFAKVTKLRILRWGDYFFNVISNKLIGSF